MDTVLLLCLAVVPSIIFLLSIWKLDKLEKEPFGLIVSLFALGAFVGPIAGIMEAMMEFFNFFPEESAIYHFIDAFFIVAPCEEIGKFAILFLVTWWSKHFDHKYDAIVYSAAVTLGFATLENILYVFDAEIGGLGTAISRMIFSIPGHLTDGIFMGLFYGSMKNCANKKKWGLCVLFGFLALFIPITIHGFFDFCLFLENILAILVFFVFVVIMDIASIIILVVSIVSDKSIVYAAKLRESINNLPNEPIDTFGIYNQDYQANDVEF